MKRKGIRSAKEARKILHEGSYSWFELYEAQKFLEERRKKRRTKRRR